MSTGIPPGPPSLPPADLATRPLPLHTVVAGAVLYRIHRTKRGALHFGSSADPAARQRWDAPDASYGVCYLAEDDHISFAETLLRDLNLDTMQHDDVDARSLALVLARTPLRLVEMNGKHLRRVGADASVVQASYEVTWEWSAALHAHPDEPDGIRYRARHDDSGLSVALFDRALHRVDVVRTTPLNDPTMAQHLGRWLDRYQLRLTS